MEIIKLRAQKSLSLVLVNKLHMPHSHTNHWEKCDSMAVSLDNHLHLYTSADRTHLKFVLEDSFNPIRVVAKGTYISISVEENGDRYWAASENANPDVKLFRIHVKKAEF